ncbi:MAG: TraC family protein [Patescibacteria group bacterium]
MRKTAQKIKASTQKFIEIEEIIDNVVLLSSGNACLIIEVQATNFALLSKEEQDAKVFSYSSLLNSLSFPIQIVVRSKRVDISSYLKLLTDEINTSQNQLLKNQIKQYHDFIQELVKVNVVLDKNFYIVLTHSSLEEGLGRDKESFSRTSKAKLSSKAESIHEQLKRINLSAKTLGKEELVKLFYEMYNGEYEHINQVADNVQFPVVKKMR